MRSVIGVTGGSGGLGASTFAATLASVGGAVLVDVDAAAGGIDVLLGIEDVPGARWSSVEVAGGAIDPEQLRTGLPRWDAVPVLAADRPPQPRAVEAVLDAARHLGTVVVDLGRAGTEAHAVARGACALVVVLVAADLPSIAGARASVAASAVPSVALVVRRGHVDPDEAGELIGAPVVGVLPALRRRAAASLDARRLPGALVGVAAGVADGVVA